MGFFKSMKDLKGVSDHHGGMPSIRGSFSDIGKMADDRGEREILEIGVPAKAIVKGMPTPIQGDRFAMQIALEIHPPQGGSPYELNYVFPTVRMKAGLVMGMEVPVKVDPNDPSRVAVQWDAQQANIAAQGGDMAASMAALNNTYSGTADAAMRQAMGNTAKEDPTERLKKLAELRDSGVIDAAEFDAKKAEILKEI